MSRPRHRKILLWTLALAVLFLVGQYALFEIGKARCFALVGEAICRVETAERVVALSLDDGPTPEGVAAATAALRRHGAHATFFLIGREIEGREPLVRHILAEGHEVGNHSYSHARMIFRGGGFYDDEIARADAVLRRAGVRAPRLFRPPFGKKLVGLPRAIARHGYAMIMWDVEEPSRAQDPRDYAERLLRDVRPGSIILMHVMYRPNRTAREALPLVLEGLARRGYRVVTVGELLRLRR